ARIGAVGPAVERDHRRRQQSRYTNQRSAGPRRPRRQPDRPSDVLGELYEESRQRRSQRESRTELLLTRRATLQPRDATTRQSGALRRGVQRHEPHEPRYADRQPAVGDVRAADGVGQRSGAAPRRARSPPELLIRSPITQTG